MSTLVLARKYRPRSFTEMVGQEHVVQALTNALTQQRLHHAYLFTGTRGVGKTTVSRILAKSLNCSGADGQGTITASPCGVCPACRDIDAGRFVDYVELDAASNRGVDEISALLDQAVYKPVMGRFKVYMIDEVHMMTSHAFNAMLKTLEEPPDYLKFVLATTDPQKVPVTVLSRCLQFNLRPMAPDTIQEHLQAVLGAEVIAADAGALRLIARNARGSMRDALSLTDQAIAFGGGRLGEVEVRQMLGAVDRSHVQRIVQSIAASDGMGLVEVIDGLRRLGLSAAGTLEELAAVTQQMALLQAVPQAADEADPDTPMLRDLAARLPRDETQLLYSIALHGRTEIGLAPDEYSGLMMVLLRALAFRPLNDTPPTPGAALPPATPTQSGQSAATPVQARPVAAVTSSITPASTTTALPAPAAGPAALPKSRELLRAPATASLTVAELPVAALPALRPVPSIARPGPMPSPLGVQAPPAQARPAADAAASTPAQRDVRPELPRSSPPQPASSLDEPDWLRDAEPPPQDIEVGPPAMSAQESGPPWDEEAGQTSPAARAPAGLNRPDIAVMALQEQPDTTRWLALARPLLDAGRLSGFVRELAWQSQCLACSGDQVHDTAADATPLPIQVTLRVPRESLRQAQLRDRLQAQLSEHLGGRPVQIEVLSGPVQDSAALRDAAAKARRQVDAETLVNEHPRVLALLTRFAGAFVVPGSIRPVS